MIAYIVTRGDYSDYRIMGVFSTEENARTFISDVLKDEDADIEHWEVDENNVFVQLIRNGYNQYHVKMQKTGEASPEVCPQANCGLQGSQLSL